LFKILASADIYQTKANIREVYRKNNRVFGLRRTLGFITALKRMTYNLLSPTFWQELVFRLIRLSFGTEAVNRRNT
jgi:hypothetical protein